ncbi:tetratricopeptide repeat protein [Clostridium tertium]|uniref:tetratricopeptide repeat protein n=1 Tax=Clostridium tertium TaxID=1559 RepID=UPI000DCFC498|nr:tetratricopeptide repeat protein [Clostridium tertium]
MKNNNKKEYKKALNLYNNGYIDKAIEICEIGISRSLEDSNLLNLKGLILYLKGELEEAISLWKINKYHNDDEIAKAYLKDIEIDFNRRELFKESEELIRNLNIDEALQILMICKESDYNSINVNNALAICYMRKGEYVECQKCIDKVFSVDKYNIEAKSIKKEIDEILNIKSNSSVVIKSIIITGIICIIITSGILIKGKLQNGFKDDAENNFEVVNKNGEVDASESIDVSNLDTNSESINTSTKESSNDIDKKEDSNLNEHILNEDEIRENYMKATDSFDEEKYNDTKVILESTIIYAENSHLNDDIMFLLASTYEKLGDNNEAIKNFEKYISSYENGNYIEESYYKIALLYRDLNKDKSKYYAKELISKYSNSIYNNTNIIDILNN